MKGTSRATTPQRKGLVVILDGLGDPPHEDPARPTPLAAARTPFLDRLAAEGVCGVTDPLHPGEPVDTPTGTSVLLGVPPALADELARGPVEAAGVDLVTQPGDVLIRCNFATLTKDGDGLVVTDRRAGRIRRGTADLAAAMSELDLGEGVVATVRAASQHRAVVRLRGPDLSDAVSDTDPGVSPRPLPVAPCRPLDPNDPAARRTAAAVNRLITSAHEVLDRHPVNVARRAAGAHPANGLITRGPGRRTTLRSLVTDAGLQAVLIAGERTVIGLGRLLGFRVLSRPGFNGMPDTDLEGKLDEAIAALDTCDVVFLHVKAPDIHAHDRDPEGKRATLERIDRVLSRLDPNGLVIAVCGDHCTSALTGKHTGDPVPALLWTPDQEPDGCRRFDEASCAGGRLGRLPAARFVRDVLLRMGALLPVGEG